MATRNIWAQNTFRNQKQNDRFSAGQRVFALEGGKSDVTTPDHENLGRRRISIPFIVHVPSVAVVRRQGRGPCSALWPWAMQTDDFFLVAIGRIERRVLLPRRREWPVHGSFSLSSQRTKRHHPPFPFPHPHHTRESVIIDDHFINFFSERNKIKIKAASHRK
jgi:hypothetical protein